MDNVPFLTLIIVLPAFAGLLLAVWRGAREETAKWTALVVSLIVFLITVVL